MKLYKKIMATLLVVGATALQSAHALEIKSPVVDAEWLKAHQNDVTILQVSGPLDAFTKAPEVVTKDGKISVKSVSGHIAGANFVDFKKVRVKREVEGKMVKKLIPLKADFEKLAQSWGVNKDSAIVFVPAGLNTADVDQATRLYWQFKYYGHKNMAVLNGGMAAWLAAGYPAATDAPANKSGDWVASNEDSAVMATYTEVKQALKDRKMQLADARPQNQYMGVFTKKGELSGHLKGAKDMSPDLLTTADGASARFLPAESYKSMMKAKGLDAEAPTIAYCNTGHLASGLWFVSSEIVGNTKTKLYDGSLVEYSLLGGETENPAKLN
ncbi:MAG: rhodanese-like domain-containing protein [Candidatus Thiodiazotropha sp.]